MDRKKIISAVALVILAAAAGLAAATVNNCAVCHSKLMKKYSAPAKLYQSDIHNQAGLICSDCHGGNPLQTVRHDRNDPAQHFLGVPKPEEIPAFCDRCHGNADYMKQYNPSLPVDQLVKYRTSRHGHLLLEKGDTRVANCVSCHSVHDIRQVRDPASPVYATNIPHTCSVCHSDPAHMAGYGIPTDQYEQYSQSVHGVALLQHADVGAPACNDCHGNHGAIPVEVSNIAQVCGLCHANNEKLYRESFHAQIFEDLGSPGCETCHGNHGIKHPDQSMLGLGDNSACGICHEKSAEDPGSALGLSMKSALDSLVLALDEDDRLVELAGNQGMEISELSFNLRDIRQSLIEARTTIHSFDDERVRKATKPGIELAGQVRESAGRLLGEHEKRRWWLGGATLVLIAMILGVYLKLRDIESR